MNLVNLAASGNLKMTSTEIADLVQSRHDSVKRAVERLANKGVISHPPLVDGIKSANGVVERHYVFEGTKGKRDSIVVVAQLSPEFTATLVDRWQELEAKFALAVPNFNDPAEAAIAWANEYRAKQLAIATKAEIGNRREATAMNTASQAVKQVNRLQIQLDRAKQYSTIKRMEILYHGLKFDWRRLKSASADLQLEPIDVFDANYGTVKAYHADAWIEAYSMPIDPDYPHLQPHPITL